MKLKQSEETSDLQTSDGEHKRKRKPAKKLYDSSSDASCDGDEEDDLDSEASEGGLTPSKRSVSDDSPLSHDTIIPPPRLPVQALLSTPNSHLQGSENPGPSETPVSRLQTTGPRCVQKNWPTRCVTKKEVELEVSKWLTGARDREGGRKARNN